MADTKISGLPASTVPLAGTEVLPIVQSSTTKQVSVANLTAGRAVDTLNLSTSGSTSTTPVLSFNASNTSFASGANIASSYLQFLLQNKSGTAGASTNYVLSNDLGTDSTYYGEFGMNSSVFSASTPADYFSINNGIYFSGHDGDVSYGSGNGFKTYLAWGTTGQSAHVINATGALGFSTNLGTTPALSGTTGFGTSGQALVSAGSASPPAWGTLGVAGGGTGLTTLTANRIPYGNGTSAFQSSSVFTYNGTTLATPSVTTTTDSTFNTVTVGLGGGSVSTNTAVGNIALINNTASGQYNSAFGFNALASNSTGSFNVAMGRIALVANTTGSSNVGIGSNAAYVNVTGSNLIAIGTNALSANTTASNLTAIGYQSLQANTTNVATLGTITGGSSYTNGTYTGIVMTLSSGSTAITYPTATIVVAGGVVTTVTLTSNGVGFKDTTTVLTAPAASIGGTGSGFTVPVATLQSGTGNVAVGYQAGYSNSVGTQNTFTGYISGYSNTIGNYNSSYGYNALNGNSTGSFNTAVGRYALYQNSTASNQTAIGQQALSFTTTGGNNTAIGHQAGIGNGSANANTTGSNNTYLGYMTIGSANNNTNEMVIGYQAVGLGSNTTVIGNSSTTGTTVFGQLNAPIVNASNGLHVNSNTVSASYTIPSGSSASSVGPMTVATGQSVTVSTGSRWVIL